MPGQDRPFDRTEFMTETELAEHNERQRENSRAMAMLSEENRELVKRLEQKQEQAVLERIATAVAKVREPLEAQIAAMQSLLLNVFLAEWDSTKSREYGQRIAFRQGITQIHKLIDNAESFTTGEVARIQAEAAADERRKFGKDWLKDKIRYALEQAENASEGQIFHFDPYDISLLSDMLAYALSQEMNHELHPNT